MVEENVPPKLPRKVRLEDFFCNEGEKPPQTIKNGYTNNPHKCQSNIAKNQQEFGHKKRIKP